MTSGDLADQRQAKAAAAAVLAGLFETIEGLEDALAFGRRYAGPVIGDYAGVRAVVRDAETKMLTEGTSSDAALAQAQKDATAKMKDYNARVGA